MVRPKRVLIVVCSTLLSLASLFAQQQGDQEPRKPVPLPSGADAPLEATFQRRVDSMGGDVLAADYRRRHPESSPLDREVESLLREYGTCWRGSTLGDIGLRLRLLRAVRRVMHRSAAEPLEPLVLLVAADVYLWGRRFDQALTWIGQAVTGLEQVGASPLVRYMAAERHRVIAPYLPERANAAQLRQRAEELLIAAAADPVFAGDGARLYVDLVHTSIDGAIEHRHQQLVERIAAVEGVPQWARLVLEAEWHKAAAWHARGGGFANSVTEQGWRGFEEHLKLASERLVAAHALAPQHPEAAGLMVGIVGAGGGSDQDMRLWLDRSVAVCFDHLEPYTSLLWYSMPRWGGSHARMLRFGRECVATRRFDTGVPNVFRTALGSMRRDFEDPRVLYTRRSVADTLVELHDGYRAAWPTQELRMTELTQQVIELMWMKREAEAARLFQSLDGEIADSVLEYFRMTKEALFATLQPHLLPHVRKEVGRFDVFGGWQSVRDDPEHDYQARPLPGPEVAIGAAVREDLLAWTDQVLLAAFDAAAAADMPWREHARRAVAAYGSLVHGRLDAAAYQALVADVQAALEQGCDEPVLLYVGARVLDGSAPQRANELLDRAAAAAERRPYPALLRFWIVRRIEARERQAKRIEQADALLARLDAHAAAAAAEPEFAGERARFYLDMVLPPNSLGWRIGPLRASSIERMGSDERVDPWLRDMLRGMLHTTEALRLDFVIETAADRGAFFEHVERGARHLRAAYERHPDRPEAACVMIVLCSLEASTGPARLWFDRAVAANPDLETPYANFLWTRRPAFGGSRAALYRFGVECLDSKRFGSIVPSQWVRAVEIAGASLEHWRHAWAPVDVQQRYAKLAADSMAAAPDHPLTHYLAAGRSVVAWAGGHHADAVAQWQTDGRQLSGQWLARLQIDRAVIEADLDDAVKR